MKLITIFVFFLIIIIPLVLEFGSEWKSKKGKSAPADRDFFTPPILDKCFNGLHYALHFCS